MTTTAAAAGVGIYARISKAPNGKTEGVVAQEKWGRDYAASAWPGLPVRVFTDNNLSASNGGPRPAFDQFKAAVAAGEISHVWVVEQSRLERREVEWFQLAALLDAAGITEVHTNRDGIVRVRDEVAGIKAVLAAGETRKLKARINDRLRENAALGLPSGATPFGYRRAVKPDGTKTLEPIPDQAEAIRWAADRFLAGWSFAALATELRARGFTGAHGGEISAPTVRRILQAPVIAGQRVHQGRIVGAGNWPAILDQHTWAACKQRISTPRRVKRTNGGEYLVGAAHNGNPTGRRYLLTGGLAGCGVCGAPMAASLKQRRRCGQVVKHWAYYQCHVGQGGHGCTGIGGDALEAHVVETLFAELDKPEFLDQIAADDYGERRDEITNHLAHLEGQRDELATLWATPGELTMAEWTTARRALAEQEQALRSELAEIPPPVIDIDIEAARSAWDNLELGEQREFVRLFIERVTVHRATPGAQCFDPERVEIVWRSENA